MIVPIDDAVLHRHSRTSVFQLNAEFLLQSISRSFVLQRRRETHRIAILGNSNWKIVGEISARELRPSPKTMTAIQTKLATASCSCMFRNFVQNILAVSEPVRDDPRTHIGQNHELDRMIEDSIRILPSSMIDPLYHCRVRWALGGGWRRCGMSGNLSSVRLNFT